jgi:D-beta-D-heptose 7-phosphate kinase/D-beta-D-heptose 1-phosphate adenosyltransferase
MKIPPSFFREIRSKKICVVGDFILDHYRMLSPKRLSPESPTIIFKETRDEYRMGGAGNVLNNLVALGAAARLLTVVGPSPLPCALPAGTIVAGDASRETTIKERLVTSRQQLMRIDHQAERPISASVAEKLLRDGMPALKEADAIVFSDYAHGAMIPELVRPIMEMAKATKKPTVVDSKARDTISKYCGCTIALPNMDEAKDMTGLHEFEEEDVAKYVLRALKCEALAVTLGPRGIMFLDSVVGAPKMYPALNKNVEQEVADVTGAGDTVAAIVVAALSVGMPYDTVMRLANIAAGIKVQKSGVATVSPQEIEAAAALDEESR